MTANPEGGTPTTAAAATAAAAVIVELEDRRLQATLDADVGALTTLLAENCIYVHATALVEDKGGYLQKIGHGVYAYRDITVLDRSITICGRTAVVSYRYTVQVAVSGEVVSMDSLGMAVWAMRGQWELVAFQATPVPVTR